MALASDLSAYLLKTGGTLTGNLTISVATGLSALTLNNASLSGKNWSLINTTNGANSDLSFFCSGTSGGTHVTFANNGFVGLGTPTPSTTLDVVGSGIFTGSVTGNNGTFPTVTTNAVQFPATQVPSANPNSLDDYEEGDWTVGLTFGGLSVGITTSINSGKYTKIGRQVIVNGLIVLTSKGTSTGTAFITGLPFTIGNANGFYSAPSFRFSDITFTGQFQGFGILNTTSIELNQINNLGILTFINDTNFANNSTILFAFTYFI